MKSLKTFLFTSTILFSTQVWAYDTQADIDSLSHEIIQIETSLSQMENSASLLGLLKESRLETLKITLALLENQKLAESGAGTLEIIVPKIQPDPQRASELLEEITKQQAVISEAEQEADSLGGLIQAVALSRVETEKLIMAQLKSAWMQATYGIALSGFNDPKASATTEDNPAISNENSSDQNVESTNSNLAWADPSHPDIDYSKAIFRSLDNEGFEIVGWWGLRKYKADVDDSPAVQGLNVSEFTEGYGDNPSLNIGCLEGDASVIFNADDFLMSDYRSNSFAVTWRIDDQEARTTNWSQLTSNKGAGLFGRKGEDFMRKLYGAEKAFLRLSEKGGETHSISIDLAGVDTVIDAAAVACGFSTLDLENADYKAIQTMLNAAGFNLGTPDGSWGPASKRAMMKFQEENGLPATGAPDRESLRAMGMEF